MKKTVSFVLIVAIFIGIIPVSYAVDLAETAKYIAETVPSCVIQDTSLNLSERQSPHLQKQG